MNPWRWLVTRLRVRLAVCDHDFACLYWGKATFEGHPAHAVSLRCRHCGKRIGFIKNTRGRVGSYSPRVEMGASG